MLSVSQICRSESAVSPARNKSNVPERGAARPPGNFYFITPLLLLCQTTTQTIHPELIILKPLDRKKRANQLIAFRFRLWGDRPLDIKNGFSIRENWPM